MNFIETPICKSRLNCYPCRNNDHFRQQMENQYGIWECPEKLPIGAPFESLPQSAQEAYRKIQETRRNREVQLRELAVVLDELEMIVPEDGLPLIAKIRSIVLSNSQTPNRCVNGKNKIGEVDQECCGGNITKVDAYACTKHTIATARKCGSCLDFILKK